MGEPPPAHHPAATSTPLDPPSRCRRKGGTRRPRRRPGTRRAGPHRSTRPRPNRTPSPSPMGHYGASVVDRGQVRCPYPRLHLRCPYHRLVARCPRMLDAWAQRRNGPTSTARPSSESVDNSVPCGQVGGPATSDYQAVCSWSAGTCTGARHRFHAVCSTAGERPIRGRHHPSSVGPLPSRLPTWPRRHPQRGAPR
jgi:hypothetical protein